MRRFATLAPVELAFDAFKGKTQSNTPPLLILHGLFGSKRNNRSVGRALAQKLQTTVYNLDLRNHGESAHSPVHTYTSMAEDVAYFMKQNQIPPSIVIGHSMGGKTALSFSLEFPELVQACISVDNAAVKKPLSADFHTYIKGMQTVDSANASSIQEMQELIAPFCSNKPVADFLLSNFARQNGVYRCRLALRVLDKYLDTIAGFDFKASKPFDKPTLLIRALNSPFINDDAIAEMRKLFPQTEVRSIDSGHWVISERPHEFMAVCVDWIRAI